MALTVPAHFDWLHEQHDVRAGVVHYCVKHGEFKASFSMASWASDGEVIRHAFKLRGELMRTEQVAKALTP